MIQKDDLDHLVTTHEQNKLPQTILKGTLYFLLGATICVSLFALGIALLIS